MPVVYIINMDEINGDQADIVLAIDKVMNKFFQDCVDTTDLLAYLITTPQEIKHRFRREVFQFELT